MKILQAHNYYQLAGGEDVVVDNEKKLLIENGHEVISYHKHNDDINGIHLVDKLRLFNSMTWSRKTYNEVLEICKKEKPDICHVHNFFPLISPSIYYACSLLNIPVVQTLHNYRLICTNGMFLRNGQVCEDCLGGSAFRSTGKKCYRNSNLQTFAVANMLEKSKRNEVWSKKVDAFLCFTEFAKDKFVSHGLEADKIFIKPNFVEESNAGVIKENQKDYLVYVGRLDSYKGVLLFKEIAAKLPLPLKVIGEGELFNELEGLPNIELLNAQTHETTMLLIRKAKALLFPSICYEGMPMTILEAFANKTPVIASNLGAMQSLIKHETNGLLFEPNSSDGLIESINKLVNNDELSSELITNAFEQFKQKYSKDVNYEILVNVYKHVLDKA